jgi:hypothetical protein
MANDTLTLNNNNSYALVQPFTADTTTTNNETLEIKPLSQTSSETLEIKPLSQTSSETLEIKPLSQTSSETLELRPIKSTASSTVDLKPVALDICMRTGPASLPPTHICEPYRHRIGVTLLGVELFGLAWSGEQQTIIDDRPGRPMVVWGDVLTGPPRLEHGQEHHHHHGEHRPHDREERGGGGGLRIRLTD